MTHFAKKNMNAGADRGILDILNTKSLHVTKSGTVGLKLDIGIKDGEKLRSIDNDIIRVWDSRINGGKNRQLSIYLKGGLIEMGPNHEAERITSISNAIQFSLSNDKLRRHLIWDFFAIEILFVTIEYLKSIPSTI